MNLTRAALERNRVTLVALAVIAVAGIRTFFGLPQAEDPGFTIRIATVVTHFPGASPERVEQLVTDKIEKAVQEMPELDTVTSQSKTGISIVFVQVKQQYRDLRPIWDDLRRKVETVIPELPEEISGPFVNDEFGDVYGTVLAITGDGYTYAEMKEVADEVRDELLLIPEVAKVDIYGAQEERIFVEYSNARLAELGLSPLQLQAILATSNIIIPGGDVRTDDEEIVLEPTGNFESVDELRRTVVTVPGRRDLIYLEDLARVYRGYVDPRRTEARYTGEPALILAMSLREGGNIITLGEAVRETVTRLQEQYPHGLELEFVNFQADVVAAKVHDFLRTLLQAVGIVVLVMLAFLGLRTGLVVAALIPMAILMSFLLMGVFGIGIDQMSLAALMIALGMLVDNAIVMSESIMVQMAEGRSAKEAAIASADELRIPLLTSSLTTAAAFLPIFLAKSDTGEYTAPLFKVVTVTLLSSWFLALTMTPLLCVLFLKVEKRAPGERFESPFYRRYRAVLLLLLRRRWLTVGAVVVVFFAVLQLMAFVPTIFFPPHDRPLMVVELRLPFGTPFERTREVVDGVERYLAGNGLMNAERAADGTGGVTSWAAFVGQGAPQFVLTYSQEQPAPEYAVLIVNTVSRRSVDRIAAELRAFCDANFPGLKAQIGPLNYGPPVENPIEVRLSGRDQDVVFDLVDAVEAKLQEIPGPIAVVDDWGARSKKLLVRIDQDRARRAGVTNQDVAISLQTNLTGIDITEYREADKVIPITLRSVGAERRNLDMIESINVFSQATGRSVPLKQVADVEVAWQPGIIKRRNRLQTVTVEADLQPGVTAAEVNSQLVDWLRVASRDWPRGYSWELGGESEHSGEANQSIAEQMPVAALIIIMLLVWQFNSVRRPVIILLTIPLAIIGVVIGLVVMRSYFGFMTLLGVISLAGIVINNAIVLLDRIRLEIDENGLEPQRAVIVAAERRLRPILLTTFTTLGGLLPLYLGGGPMWEPMAVAIMFGLLFATVLTLGVVPVVYSLFFRLRYRDFEY